MNALSESRYCRTFVRNLDEIPTYTTAWPDPAIVDWPDDFHDDLLDELADTDIAEIVADVIDLDEPAEIVLDLRRAFGHVPDPVEMVVWLVWCAHLTGRYLAFGGGRGWFALEPEHQPLPIGAAA